MPYQSSPTTIACDVAEMTQLAKRLGDYFTQLQEITIPSEHINFGSADALSAYRGFNVDFTTRRDLLSVWLNETPHAIYKTRDQFIHHEETSIEAFEKDKSTYL